MVRFLEGEAVTVWEGDEGVISNSDRIICKGSLGCVFEVTIGGRTRLLDCVDRVITEASLFIVKDTLLLDTAVIDTLVERAVGEEDVPDKVTMEE